MSEASERKKLNTFFTFQIVKMPATIHILVQNYEIPWLFLTFLVFKISLTNLQNSLTFPWPWRTIKFPWLFPDLWPSCEQTGRMPRLIWVFAGSTLTFLVLSCRGSFVLYPCANLFVYGIFRSLRICLMLRAWILLSKSVLRVQLFLRECKYNKCPHQLYFRS